MSTFLAQHGLTEEMVMAVMGVNRYAYVKPMADSHGEVIYTVFAADGTPLATFDSEDEAVFSIHSHNLTPAQIH